MPKKLGLVALCKNARGGRSRPWAGVINARAEMKKEKDDKYRRKNRKVAKKRKLAMKTSSQSYRFYF